MLMTNYSFVVSNDRFFQNMMDDGDSGGLCRRHLMVLPCYKHVLVITNNWCRLMLTPIYGDRPGRHHLSSPVNGVKVTS